MKTTKRILAIALAALMTFGAFTLADSAAPNEPMSTAIYGEFKISSPDQDVTVNSQNGAVYYDESTPSTLPVTLQILEPGQYIVEMAPGITVAEQTTLGVYHINGTAELTLRDLRIEAPATPYTNISPLLGFCGNTTLRLEGENRIVAAPYTGLFFTGLVAIHGSYEVTAEGPGSLFVDASAARGRMAIGRAVYGEGEPKLIVNSGTVTALGGTWASGIGRVDVEINGGEVKAVGGEDATGIGNSFNTVQSLLVTGGTVSATGGKGAPGLGCGDDDNGLITVDIEGGTVTATGGEGAPGMGNTSTQGGTARITIKGGTVTVFGGVDDSVTIAGGTLIDGNAPDEPEMSTAIYGEFKISSPDQNVTDNGIDGTVWYYESNQGFNLMVWKAGTYLIEMAPGVEIARNTKLGFDIGPNKIPEKMDVTLRNVKIEKGQDNLAALIESVYCVDLILRLEGENSLVAYENGRLNGYGPRYFVLATGINCTTTIEGPGSLLIDANGTPNLGGIGKRNGGTFDTGRNKTIINGGTVTAIAGLNASALGGYSGTSCDLEINGGIVTAIGGDNAPGIGDPYFDEGIFTNIAINGGVITAVGGAGKPDIQGKGALNGDALVFADEIKGMELTRGLVFSNGIGTLYGDEVTVTENAEFPEGSELTIPADKTLAVLKNKTVQNKGTIINNGTILANMAGYGSLIPEPAAPHTHYYVGTVSAPSCTEQGFSTHTCECGDSYDDNYINALGHEWDEWAIGEETRVCKRDASHTEIRPVYPTHNYTSVTTPPTCTAQGYTTYTCECGDSYDDDYANALGHDWGAWTVTRPATRTQAGEEIRVCKHDASHRETRVIPIPPPINVIPGTTVEATVWNWILYLLFFGWIWMK